MEEREGQCGYRQGGDEGYARFGGRDVSEKGAGVGVIMDERNSL